MVRRTWPSRFRIAERTQFTAEQSHLFRERAHLLFESLYAGFFRRSNRCCRRSFLLLGDLSVRGSFLRASTYRQKNNQGQNEDSFHGNTPVRKWKLLAEDETLKKS